MSADLEQIANRAVSMALDAGASDAECTLAQGDEFSVSVRLGEVESLKEAGSSGAGIRILVGNRAGSAYTSDLGEEGIRRMVHQAMEIAEIATEDPYAGLPETEELGRFNGNLDLFFDDVANIPAEKKIETRSGPFACALISSAPLRNVSAVALRYQAQVSAYVFLLTERYPYSGPTDPQLAEPPPVPAPELSGV